MNILITTFFRAHNYGAMLQAYALQKILKERNYNVEFLNYHDKDIDKHYKIIYTQGENIIMKFKAIIASFYYLPINIKRYQVFKKFQNQYLITTKQVYKNEYEVKQNPPCSDIYITGSDQVWSSNSDRNLSDIYTLNFGDDKTKRISYAASIGLDKLSDKQKEIYKVKLKKIDYMSVREITAKRILSDIYKEDINVVLDPTLLLSKDEWDFFCDDIQPVPEKYILVYIVNKNDQCTRIVNELSSITGLKVIHFGRGKKYENILKSSYSEGPKEFVKLIQNAEYIVTTSFHATVFSIIFNKKFWVVPHQVTGSRVIDLLNELDLSERMVFTYNDFLTKNYDSKIDFENAIKVIEKQKSASIKWLFDVIDS
ncbi:MAG: polysaccharide pyruvyl transferase family protein [Massilimicrobiota sp.]|nr:polysaccharide pyruvyl transferase family protein [Massilimicrobiota sp.]